MAAPAADRVDAVAEIPLARAGVRGILGDDALLERHRAGDHLKDRAGVVRIADGLVSPLLVLRRGVGLVLQRHPQLGEVLARQAVVIRERLLRLLQLLLRLRGVHGEL